MHNEVKFGSKCELKNVSAIYNLLEAFCIEMNEISLHIGSNIRLTVVSGCYSREYILIIQ